MMNKAKARAKAEGCEIDDILLNFIYGEDGYGKKVGVRERIACIKLWKEYTSPKLTEGGEADQNALPNIYLPKHRDEGKVVPIDK
jgi:hypothetical protein